MKLDESGVGSWGMTSPDGIAIPLTGVAVEGSLYGSILAVRMRQRWTNTNKVPLETLWHVPLPDHAVVQGLEVKRGGVSRHAIVLSRDEAFNRYEDAIEEGWRTPCSTRKQRESTLSGWAIWTLGLPACYAFVGSHRGRFS